MPSAPPLSMPAYTPGRNIVDYLTKKWAAVIGALQPYEISMLAEVTQIALPSAKEDLIRAMFMIQAITAKNDENDMRLLLRSINKEDLMTLERFPAQDSSIMMKELKQKFKRQAGRALILVDGDNFPNAAKIGIELFPPPLPPQAELGFIVVSFVSQSANFKSFQLAADQPWYSFVHARTNAKDAADHVLTGAAFIANNICDVSVPMYILSRDGFARETVETLKTLEPERTITLISPDQFPGILIYHASHGGFHVEREQPLSPLGVSPTAQTLTQTRAILPPASAPAVPAPTATPFQATSQGPRFHIEDATETEHATSTAPQTSPPALRPSIPVPSSVSAPKSSKPNPSKEQDTSRPWRDYVCPVCHQPGGLP
jgi:hypothetical protein